MLFISSEFFSIYIACWVIILLLYCLCQSQYWGWSFALLIHQGIVPMSCRWFNTKMLSLTADDDDKLYFNCILSLCKISFILLFYLLIVCNTLWHVHMKKQTATLLFRADEFILCTQQLFIIIILHVGLWLLILDTGQFFYEWMYVFI